MSSLVLGSAGQIGGHLVSYLQQFEKVRTFDIVDSPLQDLRIANNLLLEEAVANSDFVYFLAFDVGGSRYLKQYQNTFDFVANNTRLIMETFAVLKKYSVPFIFTSSQMSNMDYSAYGTLKRLGEYYTEILGGLTVKFWNVYGVEHDADKSHVITDFIRKAITTGKIDMLTDGKEQRQFLYADDCCACLKLLASQYTTLNRAANYHITSFTWSSILQVAECINSLIPCKILPATTTDTVQFDKLNEPDKSILNYWKPTISLQQGIEKVYEYEKAHK